jgi:rhodanese-related sulfurtransferase
MKKYVVVLMLILLFGLAACGDQENSANNNDIAYNQIDAETAKAMMDENPEAVILDVREQDEYDSGHIPGAVLLPMGDIDAETAAALIPSTDTKVLVYCRSGNRSKVASDSLAGLGYTQVYEFGGIMDWPYDVE